MATKYHQQQKQLHPNQVHFHWTNENEKEPARRRNLQEEPEPAPPTPISPPKLPPAWNNTPTLENPLDLNRTLPTKSHRRITVRFDDDASVPRAEKNRRNLTADPNKIVDPRHRRLFSLPEYASLRTAYATSAKLRPHKDRIANSAAAIRDLALRDDRNPNLIHPTAHTSTRITRRKDRIAASTFEPRRALRDALNRDGGDLAMTIRKTAARAALESSRNEETYDVRRLKEKEGRGEGKEGFGRFFGECGRAREERDTVTGRVTTARAKISTSELYRRSRLDAEKPRIDEFRPPVMETDLVDLSRPVSYIGTDILDLHQVEKITLTFASVAINVLDAKIAADSRLAIDEEDFLLPRHRHRRRT